MVTDYNFNFLKNLEQDSGQTRIDKTRNLGMITWLNTKVTFFQFGMHYLCSVFVGQCAST